MNIGNYKPSKRGEPQLFRHDNQTMCGAFYALSHPSRWEIVRLLREKEMNCAEISAHLKNCQAEVSRHIQKLVDTGIVDRRHFKTSSIYSLNLERLQEIKDEFLKI